ADRTCIHDPFPGTPAEGVAVKALLDVDAGAGHITIDLTDNIDCLPSGLNLSEACARTAAMIGVFNSLDHNVPRNAGSFRRITVKLRENCVVGIPVHPASCSV
ncbi:hydantoinase B/oxoprolinase family protein, partial [Rhizobiaceae sp. 2RAB30]